MPKPLYHTWRDVSNRKASQPIEQQTNAATKAGGNFFFFQHRKLFKVLKNFLSYQDVTKAFKSFQIFTEAEAWSWIASQKNTLLATQSGSLSSIPNYLNISTKWKSTKRWDQETSKPTVTIVSQDMKHPQQDMSFPQPSNPVITPTLPIHLSLVNEKLCFWPGALFHLKFHQSELCKEI